MIVVDIAAARERLATAQAGPQYVLARRIRELRKAVGMTQAELARRTNIRRPNIARLEAGRHMITLDVVMRVARALPCKPSTILGVLDEVGG